MSKWKRKADGYSVKAGFYAFLKGNVCVLVIIATVAVMVAVIMTAGKLNINKIDSEKNAQFDYDWRYSVDGGEFRSVELPYSEKGEIKKNITLKNRLPGETIKGATVLLRTSQQNVEVFVAGELVYRSFNGVGVPVPTSAYHFARMPADAAGKDITVVLSSPYPRYAGLINQIYVGSKASNVFFLVREDNFRFAAGFIIFLMGVMLAGVFLFTSIHRNMLGISYLGAFFVSAGFWVMAESRLLQFIIPYPLAVTNASIYALTLLPVFASLYYYSSQQSKPRRMGIAVIALMFSISLSMGAVAFIKPRLPLVLFPAYLVAIGIYVLCAFIWIMTYGTAKKRRLSISAIGIVFFAVCGLIELVLYLSDIKNYNRSNLLTLGLFLLCVMMLIDLAQNFMRVYKDAVKVKALTVLAYTDSLTGLPNRTAFLERMANTEAADSGVLLAMFDINNLKSTNDTMGHLVGDAMIRHSVKAIKSSMREDDNLYRIGGDEFAAILRHGGELHQDMLEKRLLDTMQKENQKPLSYVLSIAYGYATFSQVRDKNLFDTLAIADKNMYDCKRRQKNLHLEVGEPGLENGASADGYASD